MRPKPVIILLIAFVQWTWGIIQSAVGLLLFLVFVRNRHFFFRTSVVTSWKIPYSLGCGMFIFLNDTNLDAYSDQLNDKMTYDTLVHEYGHNLQSIILGPLFFPVIAIPSLIWASVPYFQRLRKRKKLPYYWLYCEKWANMLGDKVCENKRRF